MPEQQRFIRGMVAWIGFRQVALEYRRDKRFAGETKYPLRKMLTFAIDAVTGFSITPLRFSLYAGLFFIGLAGLLIIFALFTWFFLGTVPGWASIFLGMLIFSSIQLFCLSVIGEYLGRIYMQTKQRPLFVIREIVSVRAAAEQYAPKIGKRIGDAQ
jgi:dolichol-phosphate mannosyltransferase